MDEPRPTSEAAPRMFFKNILVPMDFSSCAQYAFVYALDLAKRYEAEVHLMHVIGLWEGDAYSPLRYSPEATTRHETPDTIIYERLTSLITRHNTEGVRVEPVKQHGSAIAPTLLTYARKEHIDLIVMGTHGRRGVQRFLIGSVAEETVRRAACPVLTVREGAPPPTDRFRRILVPLDFSDHSEEQLRFGRAVATTHGAHLNLLHVVEPAPFLGILTGAMTASDLVPNLQGRARAHLERLAEQFDDPEVPAELHVEEGHAAATIVQFAEQHAIDLIVIATQGHSGIAHFLIGSVAERVVRAAPCPVLTIKTTAARTETEVLEAEEEQATQAG